MQATCMFIINNKRKLCVKHFINCSCLAGKNSTISMKLQIKILLEFYECLHLQFLILNPQFLMV